MATRMQQRRGTAAQWISTHNGDGPILNPGELGFETDTGKFKIGDGVNHWVDLDYFLDESEINSITGDYVLTSTLGQLNGVATLDGSGKLTANQVPNIDELAQDAVDLALVAGTGLNKTYNDNANTVTIDIDSTVVTLDGSQTLTNKTITSPSGLVKGDVGLGNVDNTSDADKPVSTATQSALDLKAPLASPTFTGTVSGITASMVGLGNVDNTSDANKPVSTATQTALDLKANLAAPTFTGTTTTDDLVVDGDFTVNGTNFAASATSITIEDNLVQIAHQNPANTVDLGLVVGYNDGTAKHAGLVKDTSANTWKLFKDVTTEPATTVDFTQGSLDDLAVAGLSASSLTVGDVSNTEFGYLNGVTSAIQTQLNEKAPLESPTFTGTVAGITKSMVGLANVDNTSDASKPISTATQTALDLKAPLASPTFTGTVTIPTGAALGTPASATLTNATGLPVSTGISGLASGVGTFLETPSSANLRSAVTDETGTGSLVFATSPTIASPVFTGTTDIQQILEKVTVVASAVTGTVNYDLLTNGGIAYYTTNASGNWTLNVRGDSSTALNSVMSTGESLTIAFLVTNGSTPYFQSGFQVDGVSVTPKWQGGTAPSSGNASSVDIYSITIIKTGSAAFTAFVAQTRFG